MSSNTPVFLLKDAAGNSGYGWQPRATETLYGVVKPDGITITAQDGIISASGAANTDLSNLTYTGNAKFQYTPFSINSGSIDSSGNNNTLTYSGLVVTCAPCTITTVDGRTKTFTGSSTFDFNFPSLLNQTYLLLKNYADGSLTIKGYIYVNKTAPSNVYEGRTWLDTSKYPLTLRIYNEEKAEWKINNDLVYIGSAVVSNRQITSVINAPFNVNGLEASAPMPSSEYNNLTLGASESTYTVPSDGWIYFLGNWTNANSYIQIANITKNYKLQTPGITTTGYYGLMLPVSAGDTIRMSYNVKPSSITFRFIYANKAYTYLN